MISLAEFSLIAVNTASGLVLGASSILTVRVFPIRENLQWLVIVAAATIWGIAVTLVTYILDEPDAGTARRLINAATMTYIFTLIAIYSMKVRGEERRKHGDDRASD